MVRRRHRAQVRQVRPRVREPERGAGDDAAGGQREPAAAPFPGRYGVRRLRPSRPGRHDRPARGPGSAAGRAARPVRGGAGGGRCRLRAVGRQGVARERFGARTSRSRRGWPRSASSPRWPTGSAGPARPSPWPRSGPGPSSTRSWPPPSAPMPRTFLDGLDAGETWDAVIGAEPALGVCLSPSRVRRGPAGRRRLRRPQVALHARPRPGRLGTRGRGGGASSGSATPRSALLRRAGVVHGLGRLGVSNAIWDKRGPLGAGEWERVRMHPYLTERMLHQSAALAPLGAIAVQLRERLDGSGYPRGLSGAAIPLSARVLGAADAYQAMCEPRPHRDALARGGRGGVAGRGEGGPDGRRRGRGGARRRRASGRPPARGTGRAHGPRDRRAAARRPAACRARRSRRAW